MAAVDLLLAALADAARHNEKDEFDRLERELLSHFDGSFEGMPPELYQRYLDVDRHWPIAVDSDAHGPGPRRTLEVRIPASDDAWLQDLAVAADRSLSAVVTECLEVLRSEARLEREVRERLERGRIHDGDEDPGS